MRNVFVLPIILVSQLLHAEDSKDIESLKKTLGEDPVGRLLKAKAGEAKQRPSDFEFGSWASPSNVLVWKEAAIAKQAAKEVVNDAIKTSASNDPAANAPGSLTAVGASSLRNALGVTLGNGGLTQSAKKTSGTISSNFYALFCGSWTNTLLGTKKQTESLNEFCMPGSNPLKNLTFSLTLKDQEDQVDLRRPLEGIGAAQVRWDFYNRRDPRSLWKNEKYKDIQNAVQGFAEAARDLNAGFGDCKLNASNSLIKAYGEDGFKDETAVLDAFNKLYSIYQDCSVKSPASTIALNNSLIKYRSTLKALQEAAKKTWAFAFTYDFIRQSLPDASTATPAASPILKAAFASAAATTTIPTTLPSLSSYGLTWESGQYGRMKYTGSIHATFFNNAPTAAGNGMRDYRISNDFEVKLIDNKASKLDGLKFNLSGIYLDLRKEPLGQKVQLFGKSVTSPGKMGVVVGKLTIPGPNSGVKIPLSMSYATRTELLPDKEWRAGLGVTFNWRDLF